MKWGISVGSARTINPPNDAFLKPINLTLLLDPNFPYEGVSATDAAASEYYMDY